MVDPEEFKVAVLMAQHPVFRRSYGYYVKYYKLRMMAHRRGDSTAAQWLDHDVREAQTSLHKVCDRVALEHGLSRASAIDIYLTVHEMAVREALTKDAD